MVATAVASPARYQIELKETDRRRSASGVGAYYDDTASCLKMCQDAKPSCKFPYNWDKVTIFSFPLRCKLKVYHSQSGGNCWTCCQKDPTDTLDDDDSITFKVEI